MTTDILSPTAKVVRQSTDFNRTAIKRHALKVSRQTRAGKFERVSTEFLQNVEAAIEAKLRSFEAPVLNSPFGQVDPDEANKFLSASGKARLQRAFNVWIAREIHRQANNVRVGRTL